MLVLFLVLCLVHLWCCYFQVKQVQRVTKVFLMPVLLGYVLMSGNPVSVLIVLAIIFGFLGDVFLLFETKPIYFMCGLGTFLLGHVFYIVEIIKQINLFEHMWLSGLMIVILVFVGRFMYQTLAPYLDELKGPVIAYCVTILSMFFSASLFCLTQFSGASILAIIGATLFVTSDYLLARSIFIKAFKHKDVWIMATYLGAQLLLVLALI